MSAQPLYDPQDQFLARALRRRWLPILVATLLAGLVVGGYAYSRPVTYAATTRVTLTALTGNPLAPDSVGSSQQVLVAMNSEAALVNSAGVTALVGKKLGLTVPGGSSKISAKVVANTETIAVTYIGVGPAKAVAGSLTTAQQYLAYRSAQATATVAAKIATLKALQTTAQTNLDRATAALRRKTPPLGAAASVAQYATETASLSKSITQLQATNVGEPGSVTTVATTAKATGKPPWLYGLVGALVALGVSVLVVLVRARHDRYVRTARLVTLQGYPILAKIPTPGRRREGDEDIEHTRNAFVQARTLVLGQIATGGVIVVAHATQVYADAEAAVDLAQSTGRAGFRVVLLDARIDEPPLPVRSGESVGQAELLERRAAGEWAESGVFVLRAEGEVLSNLRSGPGFRTLLDELSAQADYVIVVGPPASAPDGVAVAAAADGLIVVVTDGVTTRAGLSDVTDTAERFALDLLGFIAEPKPSPRTYSTTAPQDAPARPSAAAAAGPL